MKGKSNMINEDILRKNLASKVNNITFIVKVENKIQLKIALNADNVNSIILARASFSETELPKLVSTIKSNKKEAWILLERISRYEETMNFKDCNGLKKFDLRTSTDKIFDIENLDGIIIQNIDSFSYMLRRINKTKNKNLKVELSYTMHCYNAETKKIYEKLYNEKRDNYKVVPLRFTAPVELNIYELSIVGYDTILVYSYIDTMVTANCLRKNIDNLSGTLPCSKSQFNLNNIIDYSSYIFDRKNKKLHYKTYCKFCYNKIFNVCPLYLIDKFPLSNKNYNYRIDFSFESEKEVRDILENKMPTSFTRGHIKNSII